MSTFIDTSAFYAILDRDDQNHATAARTWMDLLNRAEPLVTTTYVVVETTALVQHRLGIAAVRALHDELLPVVDVAFPSLSLHQRAVAALLIAERRRLGLVDCASFEMMRQQGITTAFAFDPHFEEQGFAVIGHSV